MIIKFTEPYQHQLDEVISCLWRLLGNKQSQWNHRIRIFPRSPTVFYLPGPLSIWTYIRVIFCRCPCHRSPAYTDCLLLQQKKIRTDSVNLAKVVFQVYIQLVSFFFFLYKQFDTSWYSHMMITAESFVERTRVFNRQAWRHKTHKRLPSASAC